MSDHQPCQSQPEDVSEYDRPVSELPADPPLQARPHWIGGLATGLWWLNSLVSLCVLAGILVLLLRSPSEGGGNPPTPRRAADERAPVPLKGDQPPSPATEGSPPSENTPASNPPGQDAAAVKPPGTQVSPAPASIAPSPMPPGAPASPETVSPTPASAPGDSPPLSSLNVNHVREWLKKNPEQWEALAGGDQRLLKALNELDGLSEAQRLATALKAAKGTLETTLTAAMEGTDAHKKALANAVKELTDPLPSLVEMRNQLVADIKDLNDKQDEHNTKRDKFAREAAWFPDVIAKSPEGALPALILSHVGRAMDGRRDEIIKAVDEKFDAIDRRLITLNSQRFAAQEAEVVTFVVPHFTGFGIDQEIVNQLRQMEDELVRCEETTKAVRIRVVTFQKGVPQAVRDPGQMTVNKAFTTESDEIFQDDAWASDPKLAEGRLVLLVVVPSGDTLLNGKPLPLPKNRRVDVLLVSDYSSSKLKENAGEMFSGLAQWHQAVAANGGWVNLVCWGDEKHARRQLVSYIRRAIVPETLFTEKTPK